MAPNEFIEDFHWRTNVMNKGDSLTISVPEAGERYFGLSRNGAYAAATRGEIPTIRVGRLLRVPVRAMEQKLDAAGRASEDQHRESHEPSAT